MHIIKRRWVLLGAVTAAVLAGGAAYASIPDSGGVIHGCYDGGGNLKVVDATCPRGYTALNWNQQGPRGQAGSNGVSGWQFVTHVETVAIGGDFDGVDVRCPVGKEVLGGGGHAYWLDASGNYLGAADLSESEPFPTAPSVPQAGYIVGVAFGHDVPPGATQVQIGVSATCANVS